MTGDNMENRLPLEEYHTAEEYYESPEDERRELVNGYFYDMSSPGRLHQKVLGLIFRKIGDYIDSKGGKCEVYPAPFSVQLKEDEDTVLEPDISVICDPEKLNDRGCLGAPDWIIEIVSKSNASNDYIRKTNLYERAGVKEYWIVDPAEKTVYVYHFGTEDFRVKHYSFRDRIPSGIYEDLTIDFSGIDDSLQG